MTPKLPDTLYLSLQCFSG